MFKRKKKVDTFYKDCLKQYEEENRDYIKKDHDDIVMLKDKIEKDYRVKIKNNEIDIAAEKIRLEEAIGKYNTKVMEFSANLLIAMLAGIFGAFIQSIGVFNFIPKIKWLSNSTNDLISNVGKVVIFVIMIYFLAKSFVGKDSKKDKINSVVNNIKLKVLEQIEKEMEKEKLTAIDEVAVTKEECFSNCSRKNCIFRK